MKRTAPVNKIIPFSNVDGPGNRCAVFFQGCPFSCLYCHNPETIHACIGCGICAEKCPAGALVREEGRVTWDPKKCVQCDTCIKICPNLSSPKITEMTPEELMGKIRRAAPYINGVTLSGGECTQHVPFIRELLPLLQEIGLGCLLDSNGSYDFSQDPALTEEIEGVMLDVKAVDPAFSRKLIGAEPDGILRNLDYLLAAGKLYEVRTVLLPGFEEENVRTVTEVARRIGGACRYKLIRYRPYGVREEGLEKISRFELEKEELERMAGLARSLGAERCVLV